MSLLEGCPHFRGCYVQASMELGPEDVSLLERCPHFRGCYVQASMELGPEDVSLLERCPPPQGKLLFCHPPPGTSAGMFNAVGLLDRVQRVTGEGEQTADADPSVNEAGGNTAAATSCELSDFDKQFMQQVGKLGGFHFHY